MSSAISPILAAAWNRQFLTWLQQGGSQVGWQAVAVVVGVALALGLVVWLFCRWLSYRERKVVTSPRLLFGELCRAHRLRYGQRQLLVRLAREHDLAHPAKLFVEPALWNVRQLGAWGQQHEAEVHALRDKIFAPE